MSATITVETEELASFQDELLQLGAIGSRGDVLQAMGAGVKESLVEHLTKVEQDDVHHHWATMLGAGRTHFYGGAAGGVENPQIEGSDSVSVAIHSEGLAQRYYGGVIGAKNAQWLTIPAIAEAYGKSARSFNNLRFVLFRPDLAALVERMEKTTTTTAKGVVKAKAETIKPRVVYWLKKEVTQQGDPTVLPTDEEMSQSAIEAGREVIPFLAAGPS